MVSADYDSRARSPTQGVENRSKIWSHEIRTKQSKAAVIPEIKNVAVAVNEIIHLRKKKIVSNAAVQIN